MSTTGSELADEPGERAEEDERGGLATVVGAVRGFMAVIYAHKILVLTSVVAGLSLGYWWVHTRIPLYEATSLVMVETQTPRVLTEMPDVLEVGSPNNLWAMQRYYQTQKNIIKSQEVAQRVLDRMDPRQYEHLLGLDRSDLDLAPEERRAKLEEAHLPTVLSERLEVEQIKDTLLLELKFRDTDPRFAADLVNDVAEAYRSRNLDRRHKAAAVARAQLKRMLGRAEEELRQAAEATAHFESRNELASIPVSKKNIEEKLRILTVRLTEVTDERIQAGARAEALKRYQSANDLFGIDAEKILDSPGIARLKDQAMLLSTELEGLKAKYGDKWPDLDARSRQLEHVSRLARKEIRGLARAAEKRHQELVAYEAELQQELEKESREESRLATILRDYEALSTQRKQRTDMLELLTKRSLENETTAEVDANNIAILDAAIVPHKPVYPRTALALTLAAMAGLALGLVLAFMLQLADSTIKSWHDVTARLNLRVLGVLPIIGDQRDGEAKPGVEQVLVERDLYIARHPRSAVAEACRALRTNLQFITSVRPARTLLLTSASPAEGKSTVVVNLGVSLAAGGSRVLIVEADLRRPRLRQTFGLPNDRFGLSECLISSAPVADYIHATDVPNLDVMASGAVPPNPAELLGTDRFKEVLRALSETYDTVIFDSAPILAVSDSLVLARLLDAVLLVVRSGRTSRHVVGEAVRRLRDLAAPPVGAIVNYQPTMRRGLGYGHGYGYGYGYGHEYGYEPAPEETDSEGWLSAGDVPQPRASDSHHGDTPHRPRMGRPRRKPEAGR